MPTRHSSHRYRHWFGDYYVPPDLAPMTEEEAVLLSESQEPPDYRPPPESWIRGDDGMTYDATAFHGIPPELSQMEPAVRERIRKRLESLLQAADDEFDLSLERDLRRERRGNF